MTEIINIESDEEIIYELLKEYMQRKSFFSIEESLDFLNQRLKSNSEFNQNKIEQVLKNLLKKKYIVFGTKLVRENVLATSTREDIYNHIDENPGINFSKIMKSHFCCCCF